MLAVNLSMLLENHLLVAAAVTCMRARRLLASAEDITVVSDCLSCLMALGRFEGEPILLLC